MRQQRPHGESYFRRGHIVPGLRQIACQLSGFGLSCQDRGIRARVFAGRSPGEPSDVVLPALLV
jgi:hypothetical protein